MITAVGCQFMLRASMIHSMESSMHKVEIDQINGRAFIIMGLLLILSHQIDAGVVFDCFFFFCFFLFALANE